MQASKLLVDPVPVTRDTEGSGVIQLIGKGPNKLVLIGSTLEASIGENQVVDSFSLRINKGEEGIVALCVHDYKQDYTRSGTKDIDKMIPYTFILRAYFSDQGWKVPVLETEDSWIPSPDKFLQAVCDRLHGDRCHLQLTTPATCYTSDPLDPTEDRKFIADSNLLCEFANGEISTEDLDQVAVVHAAEESAREQLAKAKAEIERKDREYWEDTKAQQREINRLKEDLARSNDIDEMNRIQRNAFKDALTAASALLRSHESWKFWDRPDRKVWKKLLKEKLKALERS